MAKRYAKLPSEGASFRVQHIRKEPMYRMPSDFDYTPTGIKCSDGFNKLAKGKCLVQLTFDKGAPAIRFCDEKEKPGRLVHVDSPAEAAEVARLGCECFEKTGSYADCLPEGLRLGAPALQVESGTLQGLNGLPAGSFGGVKRKRATRKHGKMPRGSSCRLVGKLDAAKKRKLPSTAFGLPESRSYPMPDPRHAANAKARAKAQLNKGKLSHRDYERVVRKANRVIRACGGKVKR